MLEMPFLLGIFLIILFILIYNDNEEKLEPIIRERLNLLGTEITKLTFTELAEKIKDIY